MKFYICLLSCVIVFLSGCSQQSLTSPTIDPAKAAAAAMKQYDADSDGSISAAEAKKSSLDPKKGWDADGNGSIEKSEIADRLTTYDAMKPGLQMNITCKVLHKRKPLEGAEVVYEPEAFLGGSVPTANGTTDADGNATMIAKDIADPTLQGMHTGSYLVRITHPDIELDAKYNTETEFSIELSPLDMSRESPIFRLK